MSARRLLLLLATLAIATATAAVQADDLNPPPWRGQPGSTFQEWTFDTPDTSPTAVNNPYGTPTLTHQGVWQPGSISAPDLLFHIPNRPVLDPYKFIRIQVTSTSPAGVPSELFVHIQAEPQASVVQTGWSGLLPADPTHPGSWYQWWDFTLKPNPRSEWIRITGSQNATWLTQFDQVVIDTICPPVPEPMSMTLAGLGLMGVIGGRLRKR